MVISITTLAAALLSSCSSSQQTANASYSDDVYYSAKAPKAEAPAAVRDAVVAVLSSQSLDDITSPEGKLALKKAIAKAINAVAPHEKEEGEKSSKKHKKKAADEEEEVIDPSWDSQTGPVLKVYFTTFATQQ